METVRANVPAIVVSIALIVSSTFIAGLGRVQAGEAQAPPDPRRLAANEQAAIAACKTYAEAQDIYRRVDYDGDGVLEYSRTLRGANSLYEQHAGKGNLRLVDKAFAFAEGLPRTLTKKDIPKPTAKDAAALAKLVQKLGSEDYAAREAASRAIFKLGPRVLSLLKKEAAKAADPESKMRIRALRSRLQAELVKKMGGGAKSATPKAGYCFKVLTGQGPAAPGGRKSYIINGNMVIGYALVAFPAKYGQSGRKTFVINNTGTVYQKDLGADTLKIAAKMSEYNPDRTWTVAP